MKIKRYKRLNKNINFYINNFNFRQPYQLLIDGTFCYAALNNQINIADNIPRYLQGEIKLLTTQCAIIEMENLGPKLVGALLILKKFSIHKCGHEGKPIVASKCLLTMLGKRNDKHYIIATQDRDLQEKIRQIPAVPLLYLHTKAPVLENPSEVTLKLVKEKLTGFTSQQKEEIDELKVKSGIIEEERKIKKRKKKGPNPLSCKKKQKKGVQQKEKSKTEVEKKKRKRLKIPQHVKDELIKQL